MATINKHASKGYQVRYNVYFNDHSRVQKYRYSRDKKKAHALYSNANHIEALTEQCRLSADQITSALNLKLINKEEARKLTPEGQFAALGDPSEVTWEQLMQYVVDHYRLHGSINTQKDYPYKAKKFIKRFGHKKPYLISTDDVNEYVNEQARVNVKSTIQQDLIIVTKMFEYFIEKGLSDFNPVKVVNLKGSGKEKQKRIIYPDEMEQIIGELPTWAHLAHGYIVEMFFTYLYTGMRREELLHLKKSDVSTRNMKITIADAKGGKTRVLDMHPKLLPILASVEELNGKNRGSYIFGGLNKPLCRKDNPSKAFGRVRDALGLTTDISLHSTRHTFITTCLASGMPLQQVMYYAGHSKISTTQKYVHLIPKKNPEIEKLDFGFVSEPDMSTFHAKKAEVIVSGMSTFRALSKKGNPAKKLSISRKTQKGA